MGDRMLNAPVYYARAQAHFNPVAAMADKYINEIQDRLRREGYPLFERHQITQLVLPPAGQTRQTEPQIAHTESWLITRSDRTAGFILGTSAITFHTTHYETHEQFIPEILRGLAAVHEVVTLDHVSRLGLRYLDAILPQSDETVEQYLVGGLHGIDFDAERRYTLSESVFNTGTGPLISTGTLVVRALYQPKAPLGFPPDLLPSGLIINAKFAVNDLRPHAVIDTDHFVEGRMPLDRNGLDEQLRSIHATIKTVFEATTAPHARESWA